LNWDDFSGECNGFLNGTTGGKSAGVNGVTSENQLDGKLRSVGEGKSKTSKQTFFIESEDGYFTFWLKDKFTDQDIFADPDLIANAKPIVRVYQNNILLEQIQIPTGKGLACKVFTLDAGEGMLDVEIRYFPKARIVVGKTVNAVTGEPLADVSITLIDNMKQATFFQTDSSGFYIFDLELGKSSVAFSKPGFISAEIETVMGIDETPREIICALSPETKEFRIVLTWGSRPYDLDAHLKGPHPDGGNFHIWYRNKILIAGSDFLDRDDMDGYCPETITIYKPARGDYVYAVHDYSNRIQKKSNRLSFSKAVVQVYGNNRLLKTFYIPENQKGNYWRIFKINEKHEIIPINEIGYVSNEANI
jgi:hypothetical protein